MNELLKIGEIYEGSVTKVTNFGAFVRLDVGREGLVHISEIADAYVKDINEFVKEGNKVKVKVVQIKGDGKIDLSIKQARPVPQASFEDKITAFLKRSEERQLDLKRNIQEKQGVRKRRSV